MMETNNHASAQQQPRPLDEGMFVPIHGLDQWVTIRGNDRKNPVLLLLHGTGFALSSIAPFFAPWEKDFTVVQWDQPGAGATYANNLATLAAPLTLEGITRDAIAVAEFVRRRLHADKVVLMGLSGGSLIGLKMAKERSDLFFGYVGSGQFVNWARQEALSYVMLLERARAAGDRKAVAELEQIGSPPYKDTATDVIKSKYATAPTPAEQAVLPAVMAAMKMPSAGAAYIAESLSAFDARAVSMATYDKLRGEIVAFDARRLGLKFEVPMFFFQGEHDAYSVTSEVQAYAAEIQAPKKMLVVIPGGGHSSFFLRDELLRLLNTHVRPFTAQAAVK